MRVTERGQVTIPKSIRERFGFEPETEVEFVVKVDVSCSSTAGVCARRPCSAYMGARVSVPPRTNS